MKRIKFKVESLKDAKIVEALQVSPREAHDLILDSGPPATETIDKVVRALMLADDVGYVVLKITND